MTARRSIPMLAAALCGVVSGAMADTAVFLTNALTIEQGTLAGFDDGGLTILDGAGERRTLPLADLATVDIAESEDRRLPPLPEWAESTRVFVDLIDGQRLIVDIGEADDPGVLSGLAIGFGPTRIPLEQILRIARPGALSEPASAAETDTVRLANGDELTGFIASIGPVVEIESDSGAIARVAIERVTGLTLANPPEPMPGIYLADSSGKVLRARTFEISNDGSFTLMADAASLGIDSQGEDDIVYQPRDARFVGAELTQSGVAIEPFPAHDSSEPTGDRRWSQAPRSRSGLRPPAQIPDVLLPAPASVRYEIPRTADRFACEIAHLGGDWTDCEAAVFAELRDGSRVRLGGASISAQTHEPGQPAGWVAADLPPGTAAIILEVQPGRYGAIQDSVVFRKPRLRVR